MTPDERLRLERQRFILLSAMRAGGVVIMLLGLWLWFGEVIASGETVGPAIFIVGLIESMVLPAVLAAKWRTPPQP